MQFDAGQIALVVRSRCLSFPEFRLSIGVPGDSKDDLKEVPRNESEDETPHLVSRSKVEC